MYRLQFLTGKFKGKRLTIQQGSLLIGRDPECPIDLDDDDEVSRHHAVIEYRGGSPVIRDLGAKNPVEVNYVRIKEHRLRNGDRIEIGRTVIEFLAGTRNAPVERKHRFSKLQAFSFLSIGLIVLTQVLFVLLFPLWQKREVLPIEYEPPALPEVPVAVEEPVLPEPAAAPTEPPDIADAEPASGLSDEVAEPMAPARPQPEAASEPSVTAADQVTDVVSEPVAVANSVPDPAPTVEESITALREQVSEVRRQYEEAVAVPATPAAGNEPEAPPAPAADPLLVQSRDMLRDAQEEIRRMNYLKADNLLERAQMIAPDFVPVWRERALLFERRGMLDDAELQWERVAALSSGTPLFDEAERELNRVRQSLSQQRLSRPLSRSGASGPTGRLEKRIRIVSVERERFQANEQFDEMRLVRVIMRPSNTERRIDSDAVRVVVHFYDRVEGTDRIVPTRALVPREALSIEEPWGEGESRNVTATYILGKDFRANERVETGEKRTYEGYRVSLYYKGKLQDENAMPRRLLTLPMPPTPAID